MVTAKRLGGGGKTWERLAQDDPFWAILSDPSKRGGGWDAGEFFATGEREIADLMAYLDRIAPHLGRERALDFGCAIGRLTRPLAARFAHVTGVDISPAMVEAARSYAESLPPLKGSCEYLVNSAAKLDSVSDGSYDLVYSSITLQHMPWTQAVIYLQEFVRVLRPGGVGVFQLPARRRQTLRARLSRLLPASLRAKRHSGIEMHGTPRGEVLRALAMAGAEVIDIQRDTLAGPEWESFRYAMTRR